jgi:putative spermidine/putrescine transport system permease protein
MAKMDMQAVDSSGSSVVAASAAAPAQPRARMSSPRWGLYLLPPLAFVLFFLIAAQAPFIQSSFFKDLRLGRVGTEFTIVNYVTLALDPFYVDAAITTVRLSAIVAVLTLVIGFPVAYILARMTSWWSLVLLATIVTTSFITIVIKVLGIIIIFSANGQLNRTLLALGIVDTPITVIGRPSGVIIGLLHFTMGFAVMLLYSVIRTIPRSLEEAAQIHGSSRLRVFQRVVIPLAAPGAISAGLVVFNLCMGAFTSTALLGGGNIFTLPILIQQTVILETKYALGAAISTVLLVATLLINLLSVALIARLRASRPVRP